MLAVFFAGNTNAILWGAGIIFAYDGNAMTDKTHANSVLSLGVNFDIASGKSAVVTSVTPAVRIVFGFH